LREVCFADHGYIDQMTGQKLTVLGVYRPQISAETWQEQLQVTGDEAFTKEHFDTLVLIEALVDGLEGSFQMDEFGQMQDEFPNDPTRMQVGYDEGLLSIDGETLIQRKINCVHGTGPLRFAVYLHMYDPQRPLKWHGGEVICPPVQEMPIRLLLLMPYNACS
jgi:hypothetical protein